MKHYELTSLVPGSIPETEHDSINSEITGWITSLGGKVTSQDSLGRKKLAYPINKEKYGNYFVFEFDLEPENLLELKKKLKLFAKIERYMLIIKRPLTEKELTQRERAQKRAHSSAKETVHTKKEEPAKVKESETDESKIKLEELDKKLDELLDQDIVN